MSRLPVSCPRSDAVSEIDAPSRPNVRNRGDVVRCHGHGPPCTKRRTRRRRSGIFPRESPLRERRESIASLTRRRRPLSLSSNARGTDVVVVGTGSGEHDRLDDDVIKAYAVIGRRGKGGEIVLHRERRQVRKFTYACAMAMSGPRESLACLNSFFWEG